MENKLYNLEILKITTEDDHEFLIKILSTFLDNNKEALRKINLALENKNYKEIGEVAHKMLGSYKHLEINSLIYPLTELEGLATGKTLEYKVLESHCNLVKTDSEKVFLGIEKEISEINRH